jgi:mono/diheme cytochrome c family protein
VFLPLFMPPAVARVTCTLLALFALLLPACDEGVAGNMADQPRYETWEAAPDSIFPDGASSRHTPQNTQPRLAPHDGAAPTLEAAELARDAFAARPPLTLDTLERGRDLFNIRCALCHALDGYGEGVIVRRGFPAPPSLHEQRLCDAPDDHIYTVITNGLGKMQPQGPFLRPSERWAIVAYIRALQFSQNAPAADLPPDVRARLEPAP